MSSDTRHRQIGTDPRFSDILRLEPPDSRDRAVPIGHLLRLYWGFLAYYALASADEINSLPFARPRTFHCLQTIFGWDSSRKANVYVVAIV
ncbi:unnamed protein product [Somion occarium]|uniref:Uncharacterized protein n=1 Tax=Somion occarium TaxID=3059160 RepID=A0ABP1DZL5_9APHY